jgi:hypothetical protein
MGVQTVMLAATLYGKSELNIPINEKIHDNFDFISTHIIQIVNNYYNIQTKQTSLDISTLSTVPTISSLIRSSSNQNDDFRYQIKKINSINYQFVISHDSDKNLIESFITKIESVILKINTYVYNKDYGFGKFDLNSSNATNLINNIINNKNYFIAIPYKANNSPLDGSEFTDFELSLFLTILSYFTHFTKHSLRPYDIALLIIKIGEFYENNKLLIDYYLADIIQYKDDIFHLIKLINKESFITECAKYINQFTDIKILNFYLKNIILKIFFNINKKQNNISSIDLFSTKINTKKLCFSGTVNFILPQDIMNQLFEFDQTIYPTESKIYQISKIEEDTIVKGSIKSAIFGTTTKIPKIIFYTNTILSNDESKLITEIKINRKILQPVKLTTKEDILINGIYWDFMLIFIGYLIPIFIFQFKFNINQIIGLILIVIGILIIKFFHVPL